MTLDDGFPPPAARAQFAPAWWDALATFAADPEVTASPLVVAMRAALVAEPEAPASIARAWRRALAAALTDPRAGAARLQALIGLLDRTMVLLEELLTAGDPEALA